MIGLHRTSVQNSFNDKPISGLEPKERDVAMVCQDCSLYPHVNVARSMSFALRSAHVPAAEIDVKVKRIAAICKMRRRIASLRWQ